MRKKAVVSLSLMILVLFFSKDAALKIAINHYFNKKLNFESSIGRLKLSFDSLIIENAEFSKQGFSVQLPYLKLSFNILELFKSKQLELVSRGVLFRADNENFFFEGVFRGNFIVQLEGWSLESLEGRLINESGGTIKVKKEDSLKAIAGYLDQASYQALVDGFDNYHYANGKITMTKKADSLLINLRFSSADSGKRNLTVNLHDILVLH